MTYEGFLQCLKLLAKKKGVDEGTIINQILESGGPKKNNVTVSILSRRSTILNWSGIC